MKRRWPIAAGIAFAALAAGVIGIRSGVLQFPSGAARSNVLDRYCVACHNTQTKTANLALDAIAPEAVSAHPETWEKVVRRLRARQMPPAGLPRPDDQTYAAVIASLPARQRDTLECLLAGDSEKQAAAKLGISVHTVHQYVKALYRSFGVNSRAGLLALVLGSGRPLFRDPRAGG